MFKNVGNELNYKVVDNYLEQWLENCDIETMLLEDQMDALFLYATLLHDKKNIDCSKLILIVERLLEKMEEIVRKIRRGMFGGVGQIAYCINEIYENTGELKRLKISLNNYLLEQYLQAAQYLKGYPVSFEMYDVISGLSGVLYYLLEQKEIIEEETPRIKELLNVIVNLASDYDYKGYMIPRFYIERDQQYLAQRREMPDGHLNFGMAHGMIGPLVLLAKARHMEIRCKNLDEAIAKIYDIYMKFEYEKNDILKYPRKLSAEAFAENRREDLSINSGWCYGNAGIVRGLMKVSRYMDWETEYYKYEQALLKIINQPLNKYNFSDINICHGYGSIINIQCAAYTDKRNKDFLINLQRNLKLEINIMEERLLKNIKLNSLEILSGYGGAVLSVLHGITGKSLLPKWMMID